jgi:hypothetical protein
MVEIAFKGIIAFKDELTANSFMQSFETLLEKNDVDFDGNIKEYKVETFDETFRN